MTGGNAARDVGGGSRWDGQAAAELKAKRDKLLGELGKLDTTPRDQGQVADLQSKVGQLKSKEQYALKDSKLTSEKMQGLEKQVQELKKQVAECEKEIKKTKPQVAEREASIAKIQQRVDATEDKAFSAFSRSIGVANIRAFEEGQLKQMQEIATDRRQIREQMAKLEAQLQYEKTKDFASPLAKITKRMAQTKTKLALGEEKQKALAKDEKGLRARLRASEEKRDEAKNSLDEKEVRPPPPPPMPSPLPLPSPPPPHPLTSPLKIVLTSHLPPSSSLLADRSQGTPG
jgi:structural maintenance of chromosome 1